VSGRRVATLRRGVHLDHGSGRVVWHLDRVAGPVSARVYVVALARPGGRGAATTRIVVIR
jgi:hypothetical protein